MDDSLAPVSAPADQAPAIDEHAQPSFPLDAAWISGVYLLPSEQDAICQFLRSRVAIAETFRQLGDLPLKMRATSGILAVLTLDGWCLWTRLTNGGPPNAGDRDKGQFIAACRENANNCRRVMRLVDASTDDENSGHQLAREFLELLIEAVGVAESHAAGLTGKTADDKFNEALRNAIANLVKPISLESVLKRILKEATRVAIQIDEPDLEPPDRRGKGRYLLESICGTSDPVLLPIQQYVPPATFTPLFQAEPTADRPSAQSTAAKELKLACKWYQRQGRRDSLEI